MAIHSHVTYLRSLQVIRRQWRLVMGMGIKNLIRTDFLKYRPVTSLHDNDSINGGSSGIPLYSIIYNCNSQRQWRLVRNSVILSGL
jgi:hypothetical protein